MDNEIKKHNKPTRHQFDKLWKQSPFKMRGLKLFLSPSEEYRVLMTEFLVTMKDAANYLIQRIFEDVRDGKLVEDFVTDGGRATADSLQKKYEGHLVAVFGLRLARQRRSVCFEAVNKFRSYKRRNKKWPKPPRFKKDDVFPLKDGIFNLAAGDIARLTIHGADEKDKPRSILIPCEIMDRFRKKVEHLPRSPGGALTNKKNKWMFAPVATIPFQWAYEPCGSIGIDLNKTKKYFVAINKEIEWNGKTTNLMPHSKSIEKIIDNLLYLNAEVKRKDIRTNKRSGIRKKVIRAHNKLNKLCLPYSEAILDFAYKNKLLVCIDDLTCGARTGSFGHDKIRSQLITLCEERRYPFVVMPTPHTSKACHMCYHEGDRKTNYDKLICLQGCGTFNSHENAAMNVTNWGWRIWTDGIFEFKKWKKANYKPAKKLSADQAEDKSNIGDEAAYGSLVGTPTAFI